MSAEENKIRIIGIAFIVVTVFSVGLVGVNYTNYLGLLETVNDVTFSIDKMTHEENGNNVEVSIDFTVVNPTKYDKIKFSSLQCQLYLIVDGEEEYLGATGYAPPVDVTLRSDEPWSYTTALSISRYIIVSLTDGEVGSSLEWRVRNVVHYSTPIRRYYQNINIQETSGALN